MLTASCLGTRGLPWCSGTWPTASASSPRSRLTVPLQMPVDGCPCLISRYRFNPIITSAGSFTRRLCLLHQRSGALYQGSCKLCLALGRGSTVYFGESGYNAYTRLGDHASDIRTSPQNIVWWYIVMLISCDFQNIVEISLSHIFSSISHDIFKPFLPIFTYFYFQFQFMEIPIYKKLKFWN